MNFLIRFLFFGCSHKIVNCSIHQGWVVTDRWDIMGDNQPDSIDECSDQHA